MRLCVICITCIICVNCIICSRLFHARSLARPTRHHRPSQGGIENTVQNLYLVRLANEVRVKTSDSIRRQLLKPFKSRMIIREKQQQQQRQQSGPPRHIYTTKIREGTKGIRGTKISNADCMPRSFPKSWASQQVRHRQSSLVSLVPPSQSNPPEGATESSTQTASAVYWKRETPTEWPGSPTYLLSAISVYVP